MDLPDKSYAYSSTPEWTDKYGVFEEDGINEYHVAMSATESAYANGRVLAVDPSDTEKRNTEKKLSLLAFYLILKQPVKGLKD